MTGKWIYAGAIAPHGPLYGVGSRSTGDSAARYKWKGNEGYTSESVVGGSDTGALSGIQAEDGFVCARRRGEPCYSSLPDGRVDRDYRIYASFHLKQIFQRMKEAT